MSIKISATVHGFMCGEAWGGGLAGMPATVMLPRERAPLAQTLAAYLRRHGGDFQGAKFTADSTLELKTIKRLKTGATVTKARTWLLSDFPSVAQFVDAENLASEFER